MKSLIFAVVTFVSGCGITLQPHYLINVRALSEPTPKSDERQGVQIAASAITRANWQKHVGASTHVQWQQFVNNVVGGGGGMALQSALPAGSFGLLSADVPIVPLPSFEVRILNKTGHPLSLAGAAIALKDEAGHQFPWFADAARFRGVALDEALARHRDLADPNNFRARNALEAALHEVPVLSSALVVPDGGDWQGYVAFDLTAHDAATMRDFMSQSRSLTLEIAPGPGEPLRFRFAIEHHTGGVLCPDGKRRAQVTDCPDIAEATAPVDDGPCIQHTKKPRTIADTQWWMGGTPVANSDLHRTLLSEPLTERPMRRGLVMRAIGYSLIGLGIMGTAIAAPTIIATRGASDGPAAIGFLGLSAVGLIVAVIGARQSDRAIRLYNEQSESTGLCAPIW